MDKVIATARETVAGAPRGASPADGSGLERRGTP